MIDAQAAAKLMLDGRNTELYKQVKKYFENKIIKRATTGHNDMTIVPSEFQDLPHSLRQKMLDEFKMVRPSYSVTHHPLPPGGDQRETESWTVSWKHFCD